MTAPESSGEIEPDQAAALFVEFAAAADLALGYPADGCYARTHVMVQQMLARGLAPSKVWAFAASTSDLLWTEAPDQPLGRVQWGYHVAPVLVVQDADNNVREAVFDPLLFDHPASVEDWLDALHDTPTLVRTALGEPPLPARGGTGYWPGPDPLEGPDEHAHETLEYYRQWSA
jgi:hypothetical protein